MYVNNCVNQEDVTDPIPKNHRVAPRPPCKSFCVQIATVCANDPDYFIQTCNGIKCPPTQDQCTPGKYSIFQINSNFILNYHLYLQILF
jgi:hypothetical protein